MSARCACLTARCAVFDAVHGVEPQSETVWRQADKYGVPRICFINKMDKMGADFEHAVDTIRKRLNARPVAIQIPIGQEAAFKGVVDLVDMKAIYWRDETMGAKYEVEEIPAELKKKAEAFHAQLVESVAENDDEMLHKFLEGETISADELRASLRKSVISPQAVPGPLRNGLQEQRRADAAGRRGRLPAFAAGYSCHAGSTIPTIRKRNWSASRQIANRSPGWHSRSWLIRLSASWSSSACTPAI